MPGARRSLVAALVGAGALLAVAGVARPDVPASLLEAMGLARPTTRAQAPDFTLPDLDGKSVRLGELRGRVVLLYFWATW